MKDIANSAAGGVVAGEEEESNLSDRELAEERVEFFGEVGFVLRGVGLDDEVDHGFGPCVLLVGSVFAVTLVELVADVFVHPATVSPMHVPAGKVQILEGIDFGVGLVPVNLIKHTIG